jgi:glycosyltransferase involved in cell wall biosynthesis
MVTEPINLFYEEPDPDRWIKFDRYPRRLIRRLARGKQQPGGVGTIAINLMKGFDRLNIRYRLNDYKYIKKHPEEIACIIGKPHVLFDKNWENDIILGAGIYSHPIECPNLFKKYPNVKCCLVPGEWMKNMFEPYYDDKVFAWPVGIDTNVWSPLLKSTPKIDFLIYDKIRWEHEKYQEELIDPICQVLDKKLLSYNFIKYGDYDKEELVQRLQRTKYVIFLCEHETQGLAYQQILATDIPILAWDRGGYWQDPYYYPEKVQYQPVTSVPYWDDRCGSKFTGITDFNEKLDLFLSKTALFKPREYILENLTLEICAEKYLQIYQQIKMQ